MPHKALQSTRATAIQFSLAPKTIRRYVHEQGMPAHRVGRVFRFDPDEVDAWLRARATAPDQDDDYRAKIKHLVDQAPPITPEQADRIASILGAAR